MIRPARLDLDVYGLPEETEAAWLQLEEKENEEEHEERSNRGPWSLTRCKYKTWIGSVFFFFFEN